MKQLILLLTLSLSLSLPVPPAAAMGVNLSTLLPTIDYPDDKSTPAPVTRGRTGINQ